MRSFPVILIDSFIQKLEPSIKNLYIYKKRLHFPIKNTCPGQATLGPPRVMVPSARRLVSSLPPWLGLICQTKR